MSHSDASTTASISSVQQRFPDVPKISSEESTISPTCPHPPDDTEPGCELTMLMDRFADLKGARVIGMDIEMLSYARF